MHTFTHSARAALASMALLGAVTQANALEFIGFNLPSASLLVGSVNTTTAPPVALELLFDGPVMADTFVGVTSSDPAVALVSGGGVTLLNGQTSSRVSLSGLSLGDTVLTAQFNGLSAYSTLSVVSSIPAVPEPATLGMMAIGAMLTAARARRGHRPADVAPSP